MEEYKYYIPLGSRDDLRCIICYIDEDEVKNSAASSAFHWQTLKCRLLLTLFSDYAIGAPNHKTKYSIYFITTKAVYDRQELSRVLKKLNLTYSQPHPVTSRVYITCLKYTLDFVIAPRWNSIAPKIYFQGREFLTTCDSDTAVKMTIDLVEIGSAEMDEICVKLTPMKSKLIPIKLDDIGLPQSVVTDFLHNPAGSINVELYKNIRVTVLPSLQSGKLTSIFRQIPAYCPYENWNKLALHWFNMYGYRLPETDHGINYYEIYFPMAGSQQGGYFIYPDSCVIDDVHHQFCQNKGTKYTDKFIDDLKKSLPRVCNKKLEVNRQPTPIQVPVIPQVQEQSMPPPNSTCINQYVPTTNLSSSFVAAPLENNRESATRMSPITNIMGMKRPAVRAKCNNKNLKRIKKTHLNLFNVYRCPPVKCHSQAILDNYFTEHKKSTFSLDSPVGFLSSPILLNNTNPQYLADTKIRNLNTTKMEKKMQIVNKENQFHLDRMDID